MDRIAASSEWLVDENKFFELIQATHRVLNDYIIVHDAIFKKSIWRIFIPINFSKKNTELEVSIENLLKIKNYIFFCGWSSDFAPRMSALRGLLNRMEESLECLHTIIENLARKAERASYPISEYENDVNLYNQLREQQVLAGQELNKLV